MATFKGNGFVWDAENGRMLCHFENGEFTTDDKDTIAKLKAYGYEGEGIEVEPAEVKATPKKTTTTRRKGQA